MVSFVASVILYSVSLFIALSPIGEWSLRSIYGCKEIEDRNYIERFQPLFEEVYIEARDINPNISRNIKLYMNNCKSPNAFATGRNTVCLTKGLATHSDDEIKAIFAHEFGHLSNKDTDLILLITVGNFFITAIMIVFKFIINILFIFFAKNTNDLRTGILINSIVSGFMFCWTMVGKFLVLHSSRQNEYLADKFAVDCGYGEGLLFFMHSPVFGDVEKGLFKTLMSSHPSSDSRINYIQSLLNQ